MGTNIYVHISEKKFIAFIRVLEDQMFKGHHRKLHGITIFSVVFSNRHFQHFYHLHVKWVIGLWVVYLTYLWPEVFWRLMLKAINLSPSTWKCVCYTRIISAVHSLSHFLEGHCMSPLPVKCLASHLMRNLKCTNVPLPTISLSTASVTCG